MSQTGCMLKSRDVNSLKIAFPGLDSQFPGLDRDSRFRPSMYLLPYMLTEVWSQAGVCRGGSDYRPVPDAEPHRRLKTISWHYGQWHARDVAGTAGKWGYRVREQGSAVMIISPTIGLIVGQSLVSILGSWEIPFPGILSLSKSFV